MTTPKPPPPAPKPYNRVLLLLVLLACVGLASAIGHKRLRRLQIEGSRPPDPVELVINGSTQAISIDVGEETNTAPPEPVHSLLMSAASQRPPAPIIQSTPNTFIERARRGYDDPAPTNAIAPAGRPQEIVTE